MRPLPASFLTRPLAHRALHDVRDGRPENSLAAIRAAISAGYGIEIDLQLSKDGQAMVFHDYGLQRLTQEKGAVRQRTAAELSQIPLIGGDEGIPTFAEVLALVDGRVPLLVEFKDQDGAMGPNVGTLEAAAAEDLKTYRGDVALMSFNPNSVACVAELCPDLPRGITTSAYDPAEWAPLPARVCNALREIPDYDRLGASFISHEVSDLSRARVAELAAQGADILCWTVTSPSQEAQAREFAANITFEQYLAPFPS